MYKLFKIDLDRSNLRELTNEEYKEFFEKGERKYKLEPLLAYTESKVNFKPLIKMQVRGSSKKELMDTGELLSVFIQHGEDIYNWTQNKEDEIGRCDDLHLIDYSASYKFHRQNDRSFYYLHDNYEQMENIKGISSIKVSKRDTTQKLNFQEIRKVQIYNSTFKLISTYRVLK